MCMFVCVCVCVRIGEGVSVLLTKSVLCFAALTTLVQNVLVDEKFRAKASCMACASLGELCAMPCEKEQSSSRSASSEARAHVLSASCSLCFAHCGLKVSDFGLSQKNQVGVCGTPYWMAPELFKGAKNSKASDVYSFAIIMVSHTHRCSSQSHVFTHSLTLTITLTLTHTHTHTHTHTLTHTHHTHTHTHTLTHTHVSVRCLAGTTRTRRWRTWTACCAVLCVASAARQSPRQCHRSCPSS